MTSPCFFMTFFRWIVAVLNDIKHVQVMCVVIVKNVIISPIYKTCRRSWAAIRAVSWGYLTVSRRSIQLHHVWYIAVAAAAIYTVAREVLVKRQATHQTNAALFHKKYFFHHLIFLFNSLDQFFFISIPYAELCMFVWIAVSRSERDVFIYLGRGWKTTNKKTGNYSKCSREYGCNSIFVFQWTFKIFFNDARRIQILFSILLNLYCA